MEPNQPFSILLVEDDDGANEVISSMLTMFFPYARIDCAGDGRTALDLFRRSRYDIVITDINMPGMDGVELLGIISGLNPDVRVIVITAYSDSSYLKRLSASGLAIELIPKPIDFGILSTLIRRCIA
jgi:YesN/AraC family two-component response regulator